MYISSWEIHTKGLRQILTRAFNKGKVKGGDTVWRGPGGDAVTAPNPTPQFVVDLDPGAP